MNIEKIKEYKIYFLPKNEDDNLTEEQEIEIDLQFNSDLVSLNKLRSRWNFSIDIEIVIDHVASLLHRTEFKLKAKFDELNNKIIIAEMVDDAARRAVFCFNELCSIELIESLPMEEIDAAMKNKVAESFLLHLPVRESAWHRNKELHQRIGIKLSPGRKTSLFIHGTFVIMDQLFLLNKSCDTMYNREQFFTETGMDISSYITLRNFTGKIVTQDISLNLFQVVYLFLMVDCAAQILVSPKGDEIYEGLEEHGLKKELIMDYFKVSTEIRGSLNDEMKRTETTIDLLSKSFDWVTLMR